MRELPGLGVEVEPARWWDEDQRGDILHYITRPTYGVEVDLAQKKGYRVVMTEFLDQTGSRSHARLWAQRLAIRLTERLLPHLGGKLSWKAYRELDAMVYAVQHEWDVARYLFGAPPDRGHIIPHGLEEDAIQELARPQAEEDYLVCAATITPRKNSVLLAEAARQAQVPVVFVGKPYSPQDDYFRAFESLVDGRWVRYAGFVPEEEKRRLFRGARGFVLLSRFESGCIAVYEAAASGLPLLLSDLPWASKVYGRLPRVRLLRLGAPSSVALHLKAFHAQAHRSAKQTFPVMSWREVARCYLKVYEKVLMGSHAHRVDHPG
jgi:glycosyltransferase involved in cell wall biosynthesis